MSKNKEVEALLTGLVSAMDKVRIDMTRECVEKETERLETQKKRIENTVREIDASLSMYYPSYRY